MPVRRPLLLAIGLLIGAGAWPGVAADPRGRVVADGLELFVEPDGASYSVGSLERDEIVRVLRPEPGGWLAVEPPEGAFVWVDEADLEVNDDRHALVAVPQAATRAGRPGVRLPGPPLVVLSEGSSVTFLEVEPLSLRVRGRPRVFRAVAVPEGTAYYVRADGLRLSGGATATRPAASSAAAPRSALPMALASVGPAIDATRLGASEAATLRAVEVEHRSVLRQPIDRWQLERVRVGYQGLRDRAADGEVGAALGARLALVARQDAAAKAARALDDRLGASRRLDEELGAAEKAIAASLPEPRVPFDAVGLVQPSSKLVDGNRVFALVGPDGRTTAYLRFPPGVLRDDNVAQRVGVRGSARYDETLQAQVIEVRELETLGRIP
jgi:hypothetical protein